MFLFWLCCFARTGYYGVFKDASIEEVHDVEVTADDLFILAEAQRPGYWDVCLLEGVDDSVFAVDLVCSLQIGAQYYVRDAEEDVTYL